MLDRSQTKSTAVKRDTMIMTPPIVGVPFLLIWPSSPRSRMVSPICLRCRKAMTFFPNRMATNMDITLASIALKER